MADYGKMWDQVSGWLGQAALAPARGYLAQAPQSPPSMGLLGKIHNAIDPVNAFGGYGGLMAMALPVGVKPKIGSSFESVGSQLGDLFHGGKSKIKSVDPAKLQSRDYGFYGEGFYVSKDPKYAKAYGGRISKFNLGDEARVLEGSLKPQDAPAGLVDAVKQDWVKRSLRAARARGKEAAFMKEVESINESPTSWAQALRRFARDNGYDAVRYSDGEIVVLQPDKLVPK